jgi:dTMP kinase
MSLFITFEGIDGCGKSTVLDFVHNYLKNKNKKHICTYEPGGTDIGYKIRKILLDKKNKKMTQTCELLLMFAARNQHIKKIIQPAIKQKKIVLCDRFCDSSYAYQGFGRGISLKTIKSLEEISCDSLVPDITFLLDVEPEVSNKRIAQDGKVDRFEKEKISFYQKVRKGFLQISENNPKRFVVIDANKPIDQVKKMVTEYVCHKLKIIC